VSECGSDKSSSSIGWCGWWEGDSHVKIKAGATAE